MHRMLKVCRVRDVWFGVIVWLFWFDFVFQSFLLAVRIVWLCGKRRREVLRKTYWKTINQTSITFGQRFQVRWAIQSITSASVAGQPDRRCWRFVLLARHSASAFQFCQLVCVFATHTTLFSLASPSRWFIFNVNRLLQRDLFYFLL